MDVFQAVSRMLVNPRMVVHVSRRTLDNSIRDGHTHYCLLCGKGFQVDSQGEILLAYREEMSGHDAVNHAKAILAIRPGVYKTIERWLAEEAHPEFEYTTVPVDH